MVKVQCIKCKREGSLTKKQTKSKGITYEYWYIEHHIGNKIKWCYLGKFEKLPDEYKQLIHKYTQTYTQNTSKSETSKSCFSNQNSLEKNGGRSLAWTRTSACHDNIDNFEVLEPKFVQWLKQNHCDKVVHYIKVYARQYHEVLFFPDKAYELMSLSKSKRHLVMCALSNLAKFLGLYEHWKDIIKRYGLKWEQRNSLETFLSLLNTNINDIQNWLHDALPLLPLKYRVALVYNALTGMRPSEACLSLKILARLNEQNRLSEYYNQELCMLEHFRFKEFLRGSKNVFISFVSHRLLKHALKVKFTQDYYSIQSYLKKKHIPLRARQLRQLYSTLLRNNGIPTEVIDLVQGRIGKGIFVRFYYKPLLQEVGQKILGIIKPLEQELVAFL